MTTNRHKLAEALGSKADAVGADLDNGVDPEREAAARKTVARAGGGPAHVVRVNAPDTARQLREIREQLQPTHVLVRLQLPRLQHETDIRSHRPVATQVMPSV